MSRLLGALMLLTVLGSNGLAEDGRPGGAPGLSILAVESDVPGGAAPAAPGGQQGVAPVETAVSTVTVGKAGFTVLAVTDLHLTATAALFTTLVNDGTLGDIRRMVRECKPDLLVITGDLWWDSDGPVAAGRARAILKAIDKIGVPWAFVLGNHDRAAGLDSVRASAEKLPNCLYRGRSSDGNYRVDMRSPEGKLRSALFMVDSGDPVGMDRKDAQWLTDEVGQVRARHGRPGDGVFGIPSFLFTHVPIRAFDTLRRAGQIQGINWEDVCFEESADEAFEAIKQSGMIKGVFCGHDHGNNFYGVLDGIHLEYVRTSGRGGRAGDPKGRSIRRGGTLIRVQGDRFSTEVVFPEYTVADIAFTPWLPAIPGLVRALAD